MHWNVIFLCVIHGPQNCMKWMKNAFRCWNLYFHTIVWCFNPVDTTHLFLREKIVPFGCGVMARLWVQATCFGVCLWQSLNNSSGNLSNTQRHRMTIENLILDSQVHPLLSENKTMSNCIVRDENACFPVYWNCLKNFLTWKLNCLKQSLIWCHFHSSRMTTEEFLYPTHCLMKVCFWGYVHLSHSYGRISSSSSYGSNNDFWLIDIKNRKLWAKFYRI